MASIPALPPGFVLDEQQDTLPPPPEGFVIDGQEGSGFEPTGFESSADEMYRRMDQFSPSMSFVPKFAEGIYHGLGNAFTGVKQFLNDSALPPTTRRTMPPPGRASDGRPSPIILRDIWADDEERATQRIKLKSELLRRDDRTGRLGIAGQAGSMIGEALPSLALPGGPTGGIVRRVVGGVATDMVSSIADPVREGETRTGNMGRAATWSAGFRGTGGSLSAFFRRLSNARAGNMSTQDIQALVDGANAEDIRIFFQDVSQGAIARQASVAAELLFGASGRTKQNQEAYDAASRWVSDMGGDTDDYAEIVQTGIGRKLDIFKKKASQLYGKVAKKITGDDLVSTPAFNASVSTAIADEMAKGTRADPRVIDFLERYQDAPRGTFDEMIEFRSEMLRDLRKMDASVTADRAVSHSAKMSINNAIDTINNDMEAYARRFGAGDDWLTANRFYYDNVVEFKEGKLKALLNEKSAANFDQQAAWKYLTSQPNSNRARAMWQSLDAKGRNAVRVGLLTEALEKATPTTGPFSPAKYASYLEKEMPVIEQFFRGEKKEELNGLINIMRHVERSGQYLENPPTGMRAIPYILGFGTAMNPAAAAAGGAGLGGVKLLFETKAGRNFLLAADTATPGSKEFDSIMQGLETFLSRTSN